MSDGQRSPFPPLLYQERVRRCVVYYFLEDDTVSVSEPKQDNSGLGQGALIKRYFPPKLTCARFRFYSGVGLHTILCVEAKKATFGLSRTRSLSLDTRISARQLNFLYDIPDLTSKIYMFSHTRR